MLRGVWYEVGGYRKCEEHGVYTRGGVFGRVPPFLFSLSQSTPWGWMSTRTLSPALGCEDVGCTPEVESMPVHMRLRHIDVKTIISRCQMTFYPRGVPLGLVEGEGRGGGWRAEAGVHPRGDGLATPQTGRLKGCLNWTRRVSLLSHPRGFADTPGVRRKRGVCSY